MRLIPKNLKYIIASTLIILALFSIYYGSYLPVQKAKRYVLASRMIQTGSIRTLDAFKNNFNTVLNFYSPVGQEEAVLYLATDILNMLSSSEQQEAVTREIIAYIEPKIFLANTKHLLTIASIYQVVWKKYGKADDYKKAEKYYKKVLAIGPKLPHALYGLMSLYYSAGDKEKMENVGRNILKYWPEDEQVRKLVNSN